MSIHWTLQGLVRAGRLCPLWLAICFVVASCAAQGQSTFASKSLANTVIVPFDVVAIEPDDAPAGALGNLPGLANFIDWYSISLPELSEVALSIDSVQASLILLDANGEALAETSQGESPTNIEEVLLPGLYFVAVTIGSFEEQTDPDFQIDTDYTLTYTSTPSAESPADGYEYDDDAESAAEIGLGEVQQGRSLFPFDDVDFVGFSVAEARMIAVTTSMAHGAEMTLYDDSANVLQRGWYIAGMLDAGDYVLSIAAPPGQRIQVYDYSLRLSAAGEADAFEPDNAAAEALASGPLDAVRSFHSGADEEWILLNGLEATSVAVAVTPIGADLDPSIEFVYSDGTPIPYGEFVVTETGPFERVYTPVESGVFLRITNEFADAAPDDTLYLLSIQPEYVPPLNPTMPATVVGLVSSDSGTLLGGVEITGSVNRITDQNGVFQYETIASSQTLTASLDGYIPKTQTFFVQEGKVVWAKFTLVENRPAHLAASPTGLSFPGGGGSRNVYVENLGVQTMNWSVDPLPVWLTATPTVAQAFKLTAAPNGSSEPRMAEVVVRGDFGSPLQPAIGSPFVVHVHQSGLPAIEFANPVTLAGMEGSGSFAVANVGGGELSWTVDASGAAAWLSAGKDPQNADAVLLSWERNDTGAPRETSFAIASPNAANAPYVVTVTQDIPPILEVEAVSVAFTAAAATAHLAVTNGGGGTLAWSAEAAGAPAWLTVSGDGQTPGVLTIQASANESISPRTARVWLAGSNAVNGPIAVEVSQEGAPEIAASALDILFDFGGGQGEIVLGNSGDGTYQWDAAVSEGGDWIEIAPASGNDGDTLFVTAAPSAEPVVRTGVIVVTSDEAINSPQVIEVTQGVGPFLEVSVRLLEFDSGGGEQVVAVSNAGQGALAWSAEVEAGASWLRIEQDGLEAPGVLTVIVEENVSIEMREASLVVGADDALNGPITITIRQDGAPNRFDVDGDGVTNAIDVQLAILIVLGIDSQGRAVDVNNDGLQDASDIQLVINRALGID